MVRQAMNVAKYAHLVKSAMQPMSAAMIVRSALINPVLATMRAQCVLRSPTTF